MRHLTTALVLALSLPTLAADLTMVSEAVSGGKTRLLTLATRGKRALFELKEADGTPRVVLRDGETKKLFIVDHPRKQVMVVTEEDSKAAEARQEEFRAQLQAQLAKLPPDKRARIEEGMLKNLPPPGQKPEAPTYTYEKKKGPARKINGFTCEDYVLKRDGKERGEACFAPWKAAGLTADEFKAIITDALPRPSTASPLAPSMEADQAAPGFPVWRKLVDEQGAVVAETTIKSISKTALPADQFEVPKDYAVKSMADVMKSATPPAPPPAPTK